LYSLEYGIKLCVTFNSVRCGYLNQAIKVRGVQHKSSQLWKRCLQVNIINVNESNIIVINCFFCAIITKELSLCNKVWFSNPYIFGFQCRRPLIFQTMSSVRSNNLSLKRQIFTILGLKDIGIRKSEFVAKNQLLCVA